MVNLHNLVAAISPDLYCEPEKRDIVKKMVKEGLEKKDPKTYIKAAKEAKAIKKADNFNYDEARNKPFSLWGLKAPLETHKLVYDAAGEGLEPIYFWILDFLKGTHRNVEKLADNFISSAGSGHFSELQGKATRMQEEAMKIMGTTNTVLRSILNIVYDLKEFRLKLLPYENRKSPDKNKKEAAMLSLKQTWMDNVDIKRGQGSINALSSGALDFVTLRDAFMVVKDVENVDKLDLNDRVKRILKQRTQEFFDWIEESEKSLKQRFEIERRYLKSQYSALQLYAKWLQPYLKAANNLEQNLETSADIVNVFNTMRLELILMAKAEYNPKDDVEAGILPKYFAHATERVYHPITFVEFSFRSIPNRVGQNYVFGGKTEVTFTGYALNDEEVKTFKQQYELDTVSETMKLIEGTTKDSLAHIEEDIKFFLDEEKKEGKMEKKSDDTNPFAALFAFDSLSDFFKIKKKEKEKWKVGNPIKQDNGEEKVIRSQAIIEAREKTYMVFDIYKRAHGMPAHDNAFSSPH